MSGFSDRNAIVTGAANGIGRAISDALLAAGGRVVAVDLAEQDLLQHFEGRNNVTCLATDVADDEAPEQIVETAVETYGGIDFLVNNAGIAIGGPFEELTDEQWDLIMGVNVRSIFRLSRAAVPYLKQSDAPRIVNLGSIMSDMAGPNLSIYGASKHAVAGLTKGMAVDLGRFGITVNYLQPGSIITRMSEPFMEDPEFKAYWENKAPIGRLGEAEEVAAAAMFLLSEEARFVSGTGLNVDGGAIVNF
ncbi:MAG: SDR family oxidoreductase [Xanthomonadales bacterium]|nr:SDR family oxidoreductase [Xanthomonadales bacterium]